MNRDREQLLHVSTRDPRTVDESNEKWPGQLGARGTISVAVTDPATGLTQPADVEFQWVRGDSTMTVPPFPGAVMFWADRARRLVTTNPTNRGSVAGVCPGNKNVGNFFFIATGGLAPVKYIDAPTAAPSAAGLFVIASTVAGKADTVASGSPAGFPAIGRTAGVRNPITSEGLVDLALPEVS